MSQGFEVPHIWGEVALLEAHIQSIENVFEREVEKAITFVSRATPPHICRTRRLFWKRTFDPNPKNIFLERNREKKVHSL